MTTFSATVADWVRDTTQVLEDVHKESVKRLAAEMNAPRNQGGNLPILDGFLWWSFDAKLGGMPTMLKAPPDGVKFTYNPGDVNTVIDGSELDGPDIYLGWRAEYARRINYGSGTRAGFLFLELGLQRWKVIVAEVQDEMVRRAGVAA